MTTTEQQRPIPHLHAGTILLVEVGSTAHGTGLDGVEDHDEIAVVIEDAADVLGLDEHGMKTVMHRTQPEDTPSGPGDVDRTVYPLRRFLRLAASGNPSILMGFWAPVIYAAGKGYELQDCGPWFVGRHIIPRYRGYMQSQALRLLGVRGGHGRRGGGGRSELIETNGYDTKYAMHAARLGFQCLELLDNRGLTLPIWGEPGEWLRGVRRGEVTFSDWWDRCLALDADMEARLSDDMLPEGPDRDRIEQWSVWTHLDRWASF